MLSERGAPASATPAASSDAARRAEFTAWVRARQQVFVGFAQALCGDRALAEDLVQNAFAKAWLRWPRLSGDGFATDAYVRRMIVNEHRSWWRRAFRRHETTMDAVPERADRNPVGQPGASDPDLWQAVAALPPRQRAVVALRFIADADVAETAALLRCSEGTVKSQTSKALATLRRHLPQEEP